jgi:hypothetical protein
MLEDHQRKYFRNEFRVARAATLKDSENFSEILFVLERLGSMLHKSQGDLGKYALGIRKVAEKSSLFSLQGTAWGTSFDNLFELVRHARNDAMHVGALARHAASSSVLISITLEDALMNGAHTLGDFMVTEPVVAEMWQPLGLIRQKMLANSFSFLPLKSSESGIGWGLISDAALAKYLLQDSNGKRKKRLAQSLEEAVTNGDVNVGAAECFSYDTDIASVKDVISQEPILLFKGDDRNNLWGLVTAFDLL